MRVYRPAAGDDGEGRDALARLAQQVDRLAHDLAAVTAAVPTLRSDLDAHTRTLADLTDLLRRVSATGTAADEVETDGPLAVEWLTVTDPAVAVGLLDRLTAWVHDVFVVYLHTGAGLPACWPWHPAAVAELLACHGAWMAATHPQAPLDALAGWHDRWRPGTVQRLTPSLARCDRDVDGLHLDGSARYRYDIAYLEELAVWWATTHRPSAGPDTPGLSQVTGLAQLPDHAPTTAVVARARNGAPA